MVGGSTISIAGLALALAGPTEVQLDDRDIRLQDVAERVALAASAEPNPIIARIPRGADRVELDEETARQLVRNQFPLGQIELNFDDRVILLAPSATPVRSMGQCFTTRSTIAEGAYVFAADLELAECDSAHASKAVGYDRGAAAPFAISEIPAGTYLGPIRPAREDRVAKDEEVLFVTGSNGVTIARSAETLQAGREGSNVFIRTTDGDVFAVPFSNISQDKTP